jgi:hypothetical protein
VLLTTEKIRTVVDDIRGKKDRDIEGEVVGGAGIVARAGSGNGDRRRNSAYALSANGEAGRPDERQSNLHPPTITLILDHKTKRAS